MLDREQLAAATAEERERALRHERQAATRAAAERERARQLRGDPAAARVVRRWYLPLRRDVV